MKNNTEAAEKYGYCNLFTHKDNLLELQEWLSQRHSGPDLAIAMTTMMFTINTLAVMRAREDANTETSDR